MTGNASVFPALGVLDVAQARKLLSVCRTLFPHAFLDDDYYIEVVVAIDAKAASDPIVANTLIAGLRELPSDFVVSDATSREASLREVEKSRFFTLTYNETLAGLYGSKEVSRLLGYEGSSIEFGGYINRGFDDIDWLPAE